MIFCLCICVCVKKFLNCYFFVVQWSQWSSSPNCKSLAFGVVHEVFVVFAIFHFQAFDLLAAVEALCILLMIFCIFKSMAKHREYRVGSCVPFLVVTSFFGHWPHLEQSDRAIETL